MPTYSTCNSRTDAVSEISGISQRDELGGQSEVLMYLNGDDVYR